MISYVRKLLFKDVNYHEATLDIIHDIKTPMSSLKNGLNGIHDRLNILINAYEVALKQGLITQMLYPQELAALKKSIELSQKDIYYSNYHIGILTDTLINFDNYKPDMKILSINECLKKIFHSFPYKNQQQRKLFNIDYDVNDFNFTFDENLFNAIIVSVIRSAAKIVFKYGDDGQFDVMTKEFSKYNTVNFDVKFCGDQHKYLKQFKNSFWFYYCRNAIGKSGRFKVNIINNGIRFTLFLTKIE